jgi:hypothetical protein
MNILVSYQDTLFFYTLTLVYYLIDPYLPAEPNPTQTRALDSSLWELVSHRSHYHATVSTLCKIFAEPFTKPNYPLEDFLDHTYATVSMPQCCIPPSINDINLPCASAL